MSISRRNFFGMAAGATVLGAQDKQPIYRATVNLVVLSFQITDSKNRYINGLKPTDFRIYEDGIAQKIATFAEGNRPALQVSDAGSTKPLIASGDGATGKPGLDPRADAFSGTSVFVLF